MYIELDKIIDQSPDTTFFEMVGRRGCGKTFGVKGYMLEQYIQTGDLFLYVRRRKDEVRPVMISELFDDMYGLDGKGRPELFEAIAKMLDLEEITITAYGGFFWVTDKATGKRVEKCGMYTSVQKASQFKGLPHGDIGTIFFDEVITEDGYIKGDREPEEFNKILYTVARADRPVRVFLCGNPDHNIEICPYFYNLKIDYESMPENSITYFNSTYAGKTQKKNIVFCKLAGGGDGSEYLNLSVAGVFGDVEANMAFSGETKKARFKRIPEKAAEEGAPLLHLIVETAVIMESGYHKALHAYLIQYDSRALLFIYPHQKWDKMVPCIGCVYDPEDMQADRRYAYESYRLTFADFPKVKQIIRGCLINQLIFSPDDFTAQTFLTILKISSNL